MGGNKDGLKITLLLGWVLRFTKGQASTGVGTFRRTIQPQFDHTARSQQTQHVLLP